MFVKYICEMERKWGEGCCESPINTPPKENLCKTSSGSSCAYGGLVFGCIFKVAQTPDLFCVISSTDLLLEKSFSS